jgi:RNA polymerase sigma-70 factor (family 1)
MLVHQTDTELVRRLQQSDERAFESVFDRYHRKVYQFAFKFLKDIVLSEEVVQDTFLNFWLHREKLDEQKPIAPYLYTIARRTVTDHWRKAASSRAFLNTLFHKLEATRNLTEEQVGMRELEQITEAGLQQLSVQQHMVFTLSRFEGLTYEEIAERMQISRDTVKYHLVNALKILRRHLEQHGVISLPPLLAVLYGVV